MLDRSTQTNFINILREELVPAMGCTEPIALAYASAKAANVLGSKPEKIVAHCSGNIIKNVRCVAIPNSEGMTGIEAACVLGAFGGDHTRLMEVLEAVTPEALLSTKAFLKSDKCIVTYLDTEIPLHFIIEVMLGNDTVKVEVRYSHINIWSIEKNGEVVYQNDSVSEEAALTDRSALSVEAIKKYADTVDLDEVNDLISRQIKCNTEISEEGMTGKYGLGIGKIIIDSYPDSVITKMKAYTSAASEARMGGCDMPVIINSGSGNQGIASSVPLIVYARENGIDDERLYRALVFSGLLTIYQKEFIGKLSAFCGAVSASCAAGAAITYMIGGSVKQIKDTVDNTLANIPGIICDGAKTSCAAKIASSLDASMLAHYLAMKNKTYEAYTGILGEDAGETISSVGYIGKVGMKQTDKEIVKMMLE